MNFGTMDDNVKPTQQADGFLESISELADQIVSESAGDSELVEELADTVTIEKLLDTFIENASEMLALAVEVSLEGNPVRTHLELVTVGTDIVELAYELRQELVAKVANRAEVIAEQGNQLRKQVLDDEMNDGKGL